MRAQTVPVPLTDRDRRHALQEEAAGEPKRMTEEMATERAKAEGLVLVLARRYDDLHLTRQGGLDSNHSKVYQVVRMHICAHACARACV